MGSFMFPIEIILQQKGLNTSAFNIFATCLIEILCRIGWLMLILLFTYFTFSVCLNQVTRFITDPTVFTVETNYNSWVYKRPAITICTDYTNNSFIDEYYQRSENVTSIDYDSTTYRDYNHYMKIIGYLNAENFNLIEEFENTDLFKSLTGEEIFDIALNV